MENSYRQNKKSQTSCEQSLSRNLSKQGEGDHAGGGPQLQFASFNTKERSKYIKPHSHNSSDEIILLMGVTFVMSLSLNSNTAVFIAAYK